MTNWDKIRVFVSVSKEYIISNYGICKGSKGELIPMPCAYIKNCNGCLFNKVTDCREQTAEFLEKEVTTNE